MINNDDCDRYQDILDRLFEGSASEEDLRGLRAHADSCPDCAALLEIHRRLHGKPLAELEAAVPDRLVEGMWPRVEPEIMKREWRETSRPRRSPVWSWVVAAQAAAIVLLAGGALYLFGELQSIKTREVKLTDWMSSQQYQLTELKGRVSYTPGGVEVGTTGTIPERRLESAADANVGEVTRYLRSLPDNTQVLDAHDARRLLSNLAGDFPSVGSGTRTEALPAIDLRDGLQAGEALELLSALDLDPSLRLPTGSIESITKRYD